MKKNYRKKIGDWGEEIAQRYLKKEGYQIIDHNFRCREGEIDIIARRNNILYFIEVKTRNSLHYGLGEESIESKKLKRINFAIYKYLKENDIQNTKWNFFIISLTLEKNNAITVKEIMYL